MPDVTLAQSGSANGTVSPATMTLPGGTTGDLLICAIAAIGTNPTIATPTGNPWAQIQKTQGATLAFGLYQIPGGSSSAHTPSSVLGGTITGWVIACFEFTATNANTGLQGSAQAASSLAQLTNIFPAGGNTLSNELFIYAVARATATLTPQNSFMGPLAAWSASVQPQAGVQGISMDFFWASGLGQGIGQYPQASGLLSGAVASVAIAAWYNTSASQPGPNNDNIGGQSGILVGANYQGMIGG